jgi:O-antigen ligase
MNASSPVYRLGFALLWLFVFSIPMEKSIEIPGFGTISRLVGLLAMLGGTLAVLQHGQIRRPRSTHIALAFFVLWSAITMYWSIAPDYTYERLVTYIQLLCFVWLIWEMCVEERRVLILLEAYVLGSLIPAAQTIQRYIGGQQSSYNRYAMAGMDPNDLALAFAMSVPMSYFLSLRFTGIRAWLCRVQLMAVAAGIFLTGSRGGTVAMVIGLSLVIWTFPQISRAARMSVGAVLVLALIGAISFVPATSWKRLATVGSEISEGTLNMRTVLWKEGWNAFGRSPFGGIGSGAYPQTVVPLLGYPWRFTPVAHNTYLSVLVETGMVGLILFLIVLARVAAGISGLPGITRQFWWTLFAVWAVGVLSLTWEQNKPTWLLFALATSHVAALPRFADDRKSMIALPGIWNWQERAV